ncbi:MFS transporter [Acinetobacter sp. c2-A9]|uniref:MFS transporter n=1 Tax=Acinetobacter sp. c2-A9 TaxID=3342802 RepID=UPI0035B8BC1C
MTLPISDLTVQPVSKKPWLLLINVYMTQYLGVSFILASMVAIMRDLGLGLDKLALLNLVALPMLTKIFYAPVVDSKPIKLFKRQLQGQYRGWLLCSQFAMIIMLIWVAHLDVKIQFGWLCVALTLYVFAVSVQDVAIDGLTTKLFNFKDLPVANSLQFSSNLLGNVIGGGLILMTYPMIGWRWAFYLLALLTAMAWVNLWLFQEPNTDSVANLTLKTLVASVKSFIQQHKHWFGLLLAYPIGFGMAFSLVNPLLVDVKWSLADIGFVTKVYGSIIGILSALSASLWVKKLGRKNTLLILTFLQTLSIAGLIPLALGYTSQLAVYLAMTIYFLINPALIAVLATLMMDRAVSHPTKATMFILQISVIMVVGFVYAGIGLSLAKMVGYLAVMVLSVILNLLLFFIVKLSIHRIFKGSQ